MTKKREFMPKWVSAPGDTIADILADRRMSTSDFARRIGETAESAEALLHGKTPITLGTARKLNDTLGATVEYWMSRDFQYREGVARQHQERRAWLRSLPLHDMVRFGWIERVRPNDEFEVCLRYFGVSSLQAWHAKYRAVERLAAFRKSASFESRPASLAAWLRRGELEAEDIKCRPWDPERFMATLSKARALIRKKDPKIFLPALQQICAESGVAFVVVRYPNGCRASGATRFLSPKKALMQLSLRHMSDDQFWFTFFHESAHLIQHSNKDIFVEGIDGDGSREEREANEFASDILIPNQYYSQMLKQPITTKSVIRMAQRMGLSPGILVGQLQHRGLIGFNRFNRLKRRFAWSDADDS